MIDEFLSGPGVVDMTGLPFLQAPAEPAKAEPAKPAEKAAVWP